MKKNIKKIRIRMLNTRNIYGKKGDIIEEMIIQNIKHYGWQKEIKIEEQQQHT